MLIATAHDYMDAHDCMDVGGRTMPGAIVEEVATHDSREGGGRIASGTAIEEAKAEG